MEESVKSYVKIHKMSANLAEMRKARDKKKITDKAYQKERKSVETKLAKYTIQPQDAKKLADRGMRMVRDIIMSFSDLIRESRKQENFIPYWMPDQVGHDKEI